MQTKKAQHWSGSGWGETLKKSFSQASSGIVGAMNSQVSRSPRRHITRSSSKISPSSQEKSTRPPIMQMKKAWQLPGTRDTRKNSSEQSISCAKDGANAQAIKANAITGRKSSLNQSSKFHFRRSIPTHNISFCPRLVFPASSLNCKWSKFFVVQQL